MAAPASTRDDAADAKRILHEDQVSPTVARAREQLANRYLWTLHHANDYLLGVLQVLEHLQLLRDRVQEEEDRRNEQSWRKAFSRALTDREKAYRQLASRVVAWCGIPGVRERLELIEKARDDEEYQELTRRFESDELPQLFQQWREERRNTAEAKVARVRKLLDTKNKTLSVQALREALGETDGR